MSSLTVETKKDLPQMTLFATKEVPDSNEKAVFKDPAFANNKKLPIHRWVPWIAGYSSEFVRGAIDQYMPKKGVVLDPFAGVGTSLIEAALAGHRPVGFEINPYAALASRTKLNAFRVNLTNLRNSMGLLDSFVRDNSSADFQPYSTPPAGFRTRGLFYSPKVLRKVLTFFDFIHMIQDKVIKDLFRIAFAATMVSYSNYSYEPSLGQRKSAGRENIVDYPVFHVIHKKLQEMVEDIALLQSRADLPPIPWTPG